MIYIIIKIKFIIFDKNKIIKLKNSKLRNEFLFFKNLLVITCLLIYSINICKISFALSLIRIIFDIFSAILPKILFFLLIIVIRMKFYFAISKIRLYSNSNFSQNY